MAIKSILTLLSNKVRESSPPPSILSLHLFLLYVLFYLSLRLLLPSDACLRVLASGCGTIPRQCPDQLVLLCLTRGLLSLSK